MANFSDKIVYQIFPKSFYDSNGDGIGDIEGIVSKLDYLKELGIDYIWLTPVYISPQRDNGYDVADYRHVDPRFGRDEDLDILLREAEQRDIGVMLDMVFNHTSTNHEWFKRALAGDEKYQKYYFFQDGLPDTPPTNWESKFGGSAWEYVPSLNKWYLHLFDVSQADLNWENPDVREELKDVIRYWKNKGIKGFRFDVINLISKPEVFEDDFEGDGRRFYTDGPKVGEYLRELVEDTGIGNMITVGEMSSTTLEHCIDYSNPEHHELSMCFNFHHLKIDYADDNKWKLESPDYSKLKGIFTEWQTGMSNGGGWEALFWCNHDQPRIVSRLGDDGRYWKESAKMLAVCVHMMRGTPYVYQGEELGMTNAYFDDISLYRDVESKNYYQILTGSGKSPREALEILAARSRDNSRTPMQWTGDEKAGFTTGNPWMMIPGYKREANVADELADEDSIFYFYKELIKLRKGHRAISEGEISFLYHDISGVLAYKREYGDEKLVVLCNLMKEEKQLPLSEQLDQGEVLLHNMDGAPEIEKGSILLRPYEALVFNL